MPMPRAARLLALAFALLIAPAVARAAGPPRPIEKVYVPLMIFADESYHTAADAEHCAECFHGVNVKLVKAGGVTAGLAALVAARERGLKTMLGCMIETSVLISAAAHLAESCDFLDLDGNLLTANDPFHGVTAARGVLSFANAPEPAGLRVRPRADEIREVFG